MMQQIHVWQMVIDVGLVLAIIVGSLRALRGGRASNLHPRTLELETSLRGLIHEADGAGRHLNDQLLRREQSLQKLLGDIDSAEQRLTRAIGLGEDRAKDVDIQTEKAKAVISELGEALRDLKAELNADAQRAQSQRASAPAAPTRSRPAERSADAEPPRPSFNRSERIEVIDDETPPYLSPAGSLARTQTARASAQTSAQRSDQAGARAEKTMSVTSDRGPSQQAAPRQRTQEPRREAAPAMEQRQPKPNQIPQQRPPARAAAYQQPQTATEDMQAVYATAEALLKEGQKLEQVSARTRLPVEEVRVLSQMIEIERSEREQAKAQQKTSADPRLGALGAIRRQNATL